MRAVSKRAGLSHGYLSGMLASEKAPSIENFEKIAKGLGVDPAWLLMGEEQYRVKIPIVGVASDREAWAPTAASAKAATLDFDLGASFDVIGIEIRGASMAPVYRDQDFVICQRRVGAHADNMIGMDCAVRTTRGQHYLKILQKGTKPKAFNLRSYNSAVDDIENQILEWVAPVVWIKRGGR